MTEKIKTTTKRRFLIPEVVQTSAIDCGPAALKALLNGYDIDISYGRLREACHTNVDGTSIDTLEELAVQLGLNAEQIMVPIDHLLMPAANNLPALIVVTASGGATHFVIIWRRIGNWLQIMDPAIGRYWTRVEQFQQRIYRHQQPVPASAWLDWASTEDFTTPLQLQMDTLGISNANAHQLITKAIQTGDWLTFAALDAATRMVSSLKRASALETNSPEKLEQLIQALQNTAIEAGVEGALQHIPPHYWFAMPGFESDGEYHCVLFGPVLVHVDGKLPDDVIMTQHQALSNQSKELGAALNEQHVPVLRSTTRLLSADGAWLLVSILLIVLVDIFVVVFSDPPLAAILEIREFLNVQAQITIATLALLLFTGVMVIIRLMMIAGSLYLGRRFEVRLRAKMMEKVPRLNDRYFQSRPISDMADRAHNIHKARSIPLLGNSAIQGTMNILLMSVGLIWVFPAGAPLIILYSVLTLVVPFLTLQFLNEQDLRARTQAGALSRFYLDALMGLVAIRTHRAETTIQNGHEALLTEWGRSRMALQRTELLAETAQQTVSFGLLIVIVVAYLSQGGTIGGFFLLLYWMYETSFSSIVLARFIRQYPSLRNVTLRLLEITTAPEAPIQAEDKTTGSVTKPSTEKPLTIDMQGVYVQTPSHTILHDINLHIEPGSHVAVVGASGAGKSTLVGLLLGWHQPAAGQILIDDKPLIPEKVQPLRQQIAWVDTDVYVWNRTLRDNLLYGDASAANHGQDLSARISQADLQDVVQRLPNGLNSILGEAGGLLSGGEGQRVRLARALQRQDVGLVVLDEPFRGLDRTQRQRLLKTVRDHWQAATLICVTHDVAETKTFDRVLVVENGHIIENNTPDALANDSSTHYHAMLAAENALRGTLSAQDTWRRLWIEDGAVTEGSGAK